MPADAALKGPADIRLTSPRRRDAELLTIHWALRDTTERGPVIGTTTSRVAPQRNRHPSGSYGVYRALAVAAKALPRWPSGDLTDTMPTAPHRPYPQWFDRIASSRLTRSAPSWATLSRADRKGSTSGPPIAVTQARIDMPEVRTAIASAACIRRPGAARVGLGAGNQGRESSRSGGCLAWRGGSA